MGWSFRKSVNLGPLRVNLSMTGVVSSWGIFLPIKGGGGGGTGCR
jgi:hypothetical protein